MRYSCVLDWDLTSKTLWTYCFQCIYPAAIVEVDSLGASISSATQRPWRRQTKVPTTSWPTDRCPPTGPGLWRWTWAAPLSRCRTCATGPNFPSTGTVSRAVALCGSSTCPWNCVPIRVFKRYSKCMHRKRVDQQGHGQHTRWNQRSNYRWFFLLATLLVSF